ncbi:Ubiquitin--protein ligase, partial [Trichostrongylus colubriformis]
DRAPFTNGVMTLNVDMGGEYPFRPPSVRFAHNLYHPNVERGGDLCIPILSLDNWKPATTLEDSWVLIASMSSRQSTNS